MNTNSYCGYWFLCEIISHDVLAETGLPPGAKLLMKPFQPSEIRAKIREILDLSGLQ